MKIISQGFKYVDNVNGVKILKKIEKMSRICYKSEDRITDKSYIDAVKHLVERGHESPLEHCSISIIITCDRGVSHELVRHRIASYSQESTRYCNYSRDKFGNELTFIMPKFPLGIPATFLHTLKECETTYFTLLSNGIKPEIARAVLPNCLKTEVGVTMNLRSWRNFFKLRTAKTAHPQMRELALMIWKSFRDKIPIVFDDIQGDLNG